MSLTYQSWGGYPQAAKQDVRRLRWRDEVPAALAGDLSVLPRGRGASQGDCCLNDNGVLLDMTGLDRFISFDAEKGILRCEAGVSLSQVLQLIVPAGWFLPVTTGTKYVTVGGAVANDVHGKNHHKVGSFGQHVRSLGLVRTDGEQRECSPESNAELFRATIGGLGLTGVITWVELSLLRISSVYLDEEVHQMGSLKDFFALARDSDASWDYTVAWIDCLARRSSLGRGLFIRGNHVVGDGEGDLRIREKEMRPRLSLPTVAPNWVINKGSVRVFNWLFYAKEWGRAKGRRVHFNPFFYPLDAVGQWNRIYGKRGFFQYQCVVPHDRGEDIIREMLADIASSGLASFLSTFKFLGEARSPGMMSFPRPGIVFAVDFANQGERTMKLFERLDGIVREAGGALYPAKDARMSGEMFRESFPRWQEFAKHVDPKFSSSFWRRVNVDWSDVAT